MRVSVEMPAAVYRELAERADAHDVKVGDLIAESVVALLAPRPRRGRRDVVTPALEAQMRSLAALNRSQEEMAQTLGLASSTVSRAAKRMGLETLNGRRKS